MATGKEIRESKEWQSGSLEDRQKIFAEKVAKDPDFRASSGQTQKEIYEAFFPPAASEAPAETPAEATVEQQSSPYPEIKAPTEQDRAITSQAGGSGARDSARNLFAGAAFGGVKGLLEKYLLSKDKLQREVYGRALKNTLLEAGIDVTRIKDEASLIQAARNMTGQQMAGKEAQLAALEQQAAQFRSMIPPEPPVSTGFPSPLEDLAQAGRASGPKVEGASGASNWMRAMAGEGHQLPNVALEAAQDMTKTNPRGGQALINKDLANLQKINQLGGSQYQLAGQGRGQLMLPPDAAAGVKAQESARAAEAAAQEAARVAQQADVARDALKIIQPQIATVQAEINRLSAIGQDVSVFTRRLEELRRMEGLAQRTLKGGITIPQQANVGALPRFGLAMGGKGFLPMAGNILSGAGAAYDVSEAFDRMSNKDPLGAAVHFVSGAFNTMAAVPPANLPLATVKGLGTIGGLSMLPLKMMLPGSPSIMERIEQVRPGEIFSPSQR